MKKCSKKKTVAGKKLSGRTPEEVSPENNIDADKEAMSYSEYQRKPQAKSVRYMKSVKRPYRAPRMGTKGVRKKKI